jgi:hypothetical protein
MLRKSRRSVSWAISPNAPASSTPVGPPTDENERHPFRPPLGVGLALGGLEGNEDAPADLGRVIDCLEAGRIPSPVVVAEVREAGAAGYDQAVVADPAAIGQDDLTCCRIDVDRLTQDNMRVAVAAQDRAQRLGYLAGCERTRCHLIEQRLKQVEVAPSTTVSWTLFVTTPARAPHRAPPKPAPTITT